MDVVGTGPSLRERFDPRRNSLNALRLLLAAGVVVDHSWPLGGYGSGVAVGRSDLGELSVAGFFVISGYLITGSRLGAASGRRYLWHRLLRVMPGFWVCLVVTAFVAAPLAWLHRHGTITGFPAHGAVRYVTDNSLLKMRRYDVAGSPTAVPYPGAWDGSLWTLFWEFLCYLAVAALAAAHLLRRLVVLGLAVVAWVLTLVTAVGPATPLGHGNAALALHFGLLFLCGAVLFLYRDAVPASPALAAVALVATVVAVRLDQPALLLGPALAYLAVWLGAVLPLYRLGARNDLSYGLYIYAFPVQQLLAVYGLHRHGRWVFLAAGLTGALACAAASWFLVERRAMAYRSWSPRRFRLPAASAPGAGDLVPVPVPRTGEATSVIGDRADPVSGRRPL